MRVIAPRWAPCEIRRNSFSFYIPLNKTSFMRLHFLFSCPQFRTEQPHNNNKVK